MSGPKIDNADKRRTDGDRGPSESTIVCHYDSPLQLCAREDRRIRLPYQRLLSRCTDVAAARSKADDNVRPDVLVGEKRKPQRIHADVLISQTRSPFITSAAN